MKFYKKASNSSQIKNASLNEKRTDLGRSMVEMIGVLALVGLLGVSGILGFRHAMNIHKASQIQDVAIQAKALVLANQASGETGVSRFLQKSPANGYGFTVQVTEEDDYIDVYKITLNTVSDNIQKIVYANRDNYAEAGVLVLPSKSAVENVPMTDAHWEEAGLNAKTFRFIKSVVSSQDATKLIFAFTKKVRGESNTYKQFIPSPSTGGCPAGRPYAYGGNCYICDPRADEHWVNGEGCVDNDCGVNKKWDYTTGYCMDTNIAGTGGGTGACANGLCGEKCNEKCETADDCPAPRSLNNKGECLCIGARSKYDPVNNVCFCPDNKYEYGDTCVECTLDKHCGMNMYCSNNKCSSSCQNGKELIGDVCTCPSGTIELRDECVECTSNSDCYGKNKNYPICNKRNVCEACPGDTIWGTNNTCACPDEKPYSNKNKCYECTSDDHCYKKNTSKPLCVVNSCQACPDGQTWENGSCTCPPERPYKNAIGECVACDGPTTEWDPVNKQCKCPENQILNGDRTACVCPYEKPLKMANGKCVACANEKIMKWNEELQECVCLDSENKIPNDDGTDCVCPENTFENANGYCESCAEGMEWDAELGCKCPQNQVYFEGEGCDCPEEKPHMEADGSCTVCNAPRKMVGDTCRCPIPGTEYRNGKCVCPNDGVLNGEGENAECVACTIDEHCYSKDVSMPICWENECKQCGWDGSEQIRWDGQKNQCLCPYGYISSADGKDCVSGCETNDDCDDGQYCHKEATCDDDSESVTSSRCVNLSWDTINLSEENTSTTIIVSRNQLSWWNANRFCQAAQKNALVRTGILVRFEEYNCSRADATDKSIASWTCNYGEQSGFPALSQGLSNRNWNWTSYQVQSSCNAISLQHEYNSGLNPITYLTYHDLAEAAAVAVCR